MSGTGYSHVTSRGDGADTYVFAHGIGGWQDQWAPFVEVFSKHARTVTYDLLPDSAEAAPAHFIETHSSVTGYADDLLAMVRDLHLTDITFIGHSLSGMAGLLAAAVSPGIFRQIITIGSCPRYTHEPQTGYVGAYSSAEVAIMLAAAERDYEAWAFDLGRQLMQNPNLPLGDEFARVLSSCYPAIALTAFRAALSSDYRDILARVQVPVLVIQGTDDPAVPTETARWLAQELPQGELLLVSAEGHFPHVVNPGAVIDAVRSRAGVRP